MRNKPSKSVTAVPGQVGLDCARSTRVGPGRFGPGWAALGWARSGRSGSSRISIKWSKTSIFFIKPQASEIKGFWDIVLLGIPCMTVERSSRLRAHSQLLAVRLTGCQWGYFVKMADVQHNQTHSGYECYFNTSCAAQYKLRAYETWYEHMLGFYYLIYIRVLPTWSSFFKITPFQLF